MSGPHVVRLPWAKSGSRFTALFEALAIAWLREASQQGVAELLSLSWDEVHGVLEQDWADAPRDQLGLRPVPTE